MPRLWPFPVRQPVIEVLEWNTDTLITEAAEQRIALRTLPRGRGAAGAPRALLLEALHKLCSDQL